MLLASQHARTALSTGTHPILLLGGARSSKPRSASCHVGNHRRACQEALAWLKGIRFSVVTCGAMADVMIPI